MPWTKTIITFCLIIFEIILICSLAGIFLPETVEMPVGVATISSPLAKRRRHPVILYSPVSVVNIDERQQIS